MLLEDKNFEKLKRKKIALVTNQTAINSEMQSTYQLLKANAKDYKIVALFAPEHGLYGREYAEKKAEDKATDDGIPIFNLYGDTKRPTEEMLKGIDLIIYDIQDIGARSYTYISTLFYIMEEAAKKSIKVLVLDRPNPINGIVVDGPMLEPEIRSIVGYINVPYCYGLTIGELATYFNREYGIGCPLEVIPMKGWKRHMSFKDTGLSWIPTSPHIPESDTPLYYPITGVLGELGIVNIGVGYTLPFKLIGAPWIKAEELAKQLNNQKLSGVSFFPIYYRPFYGKFMNEDCQGVLISVTDPLKYRPLVIQYAIIAALKQLYPKQFHEGLKGAQKRKKMFTQVIGTEKLWDALQQKTAIKWNFKSLHEKERNDFREKRKEYLMLDYAG